MPTEVGGNAKPNRGSGFGRPPQHLKNPLLESVALCILGAYPTMPAARTTVPGI